MRQMKFKMKLKMSRQEKSFVRIAMALIKEHYPFEPQRIAVASNMYRRWLERKGIKKKKI